MKVKSQGLMKVKNQGLMKVKSQGQVEALACHASKKEVYPN